MVVEVLSAGLRTPGVRVGVTGHRVLPLRHDLAGAVDRLLDEFETRVGGSTRSSVVAFTVVSALAEGADRLVTERVLARPHASLEAVLPVERARYRATFTGTASALAFDALLLCARTIVERTDGIDIEEGYEWAGDQVVGRCDVLLAIWDGKPARGRGGTASVVQRARDRCTPLVWLDPASGMVRERTDRAAGD